MSLKLGHVERMHSNSFYIMGNDDWVDQSASSKLSLINSKDNPNIPIIEVSLILFIDGTLLKLWLEGLERKLKQLQLFLKCFFWQFIWVWRYRHCRKKYIICVLMIRSWHSRDYFARSGYFLMLLKVSINRRITL